MSAAKMLASAFAEGVQLPPRPRLRNCSAAARSRQRKGFMDEHCHLARRSNGQSLLLLQERALTIQYVETHHPLIKGRVAKIIGEGRFDRHLYLPSRLAESNGRNDGTRCHSLHSQRREALPADSPLKPKTTERVCGVGMSGRLAIGEAFSSKQCKLTPQILPPRAAKAAIRPKTGLPFSNDSPEKQVSRGRRIRTANCRSRMGGCSNNSFVGWEQNVFDQEQFLH